jgi:hypothetical protein
VRVKGGGGRTGAGVHREEAGEPGREQLLQQREDADRGGRYPPTGFGHTPLQKHRGCRPPSRMRCKADGQSRKAAEPRRPPPDREEVRVVLPRLGLANLGFSRIVLSDIDVPNMLVDMIYSGWAVAQSDNATEPYADLQDPRRPAPDPPAVDARADDARERAPPRRRLGGAAVA